MNRSGEVGVFEVVNRMSPLGYGRRSPTTRHSTVTTLTVVLKTINVGTIAMGLPGPFELLVIAAILLILVGLPLAIIVLVILLLKRNRNGQPKDNEHHD